MNISLQIGRGFFRTFTSWKHTTKTLLGLFIVGAVVVLVAAIALLMQFSGGFGTEHPLVYYTITRSDLPIVVTERGNLEAQLETTIRCEVENVSVDRSGNYGTQIIFIVPNGSPVKEGDLLVELDSSAIRDRLDSQTLSYDRAVSARIQATARFENQKIQNETALAQAKLKVALAELELEMYMDRENGTFQLALEDIERQMDDANNAILEARASLELEKTEKSGVEELFKLGYRGQSDLNQSHLKFLQAEDRLAASINKLKTFQATRRKLENYERKMQELQLRGNVETAQRGLLQVENDNTSLLEQANAAKEEAEKSEQKEKERLNKLETQLVLCKIHAPHDGMVVYARGEDRQSSSNIAEGVTVRERQRLITLPKLTLMQVRTQIHEAVLDQVQPKLPVTVRIDAFPDQTYRGMVHDVAVVPSSNSWFSSGVKTYETIVRIEDEVTNLKPGMTAVVEIHVDRIRDVLAVPVQAIVQIERDNWCYVDASGSVERRMVKLGRSNDKFVHIQEGLAQGERVVLNPMAIVDEQKEKAITPDAGAPEVPEVTPGALTEAQESGESKLTGKTSNSVADEQRDRFRTRPDGLSEASRSDNAPAGRRPKNASPLKRSSVPTTDQSGGGE